MENRIFVLADELRNKREAKKLLEDGVKNVNAELEEIENELVELMLQEEMQSFSRAGQMFYLRNSVKASAKAGMQPELMRYLKDNGAADLVKETVNANTLSGWVKEQLEENDDELPQELAELVNLYEKTAIGIRKA